MPDTSVRLHRAAREDATDMLIWSDQFKRTRTVYVGPLEMP
jgi:hypothetical protein